MKKKTYQPPVTETTCAPTVRLLQASGYSGPLGAKSDIDYYSIHENDGKESPETHNSVWSDD